MPGIALIGVGKDNSFGHPSDVTIEKLNKIKCKILRTDEMGEIIVYVNKNLKYNVKHCILNIDTVK